jgi:glucosamine 6-phosphate synthetase-like amidotransferase/phosphosugar isomerase protein
MCGIFGATTIDTFEILYKKNAIRGKFAGGSLYTTPSGDMYLKKWEGVKEPGHLTGERIWCQDHKLFMGHTQAPTSAEREYKVTTTHPFEHGWFLVAHNGVLENHEELRKEYLSTAIGECGTTSFNTSKSKVDSAVIPALLDELYVGDDVHAIKETFSKIKGTFACWIYSKHTKQAYLVRSGSTLFGNYENSTFSSIKISGIAEEEIPEGEVLCITPEGLTQVETFTKNSPFFIL